MSNVNSKPLQKYFVLRPEEYQNLILLKVEEERLAAYEKNMLKILRDPKLTVNQKLKQYQDILFKRLLTRMEPQRARAPVPGPGPGTGYPPPGAQDPSEEYRKVNGVQSRGTDTDELNIINSRYDERLNELFSHRPALAEKGRTSMGSNAEDDTLFEEAAEELYETTASAEKGFEKIVAPSSARKSKASAARVDVENLFVDLESEKQEIFEKLRRDSAPENIPKDFRKLKISNLEDEDKDYVLVEDPVTNMQYTVEKSPLFVEQQKKVARKKRMNELESLSRPATSTPLISRLRSGKQSGEGVSDLISYWTSFEAYMDQ